MDKFKIGDEVELISNVAGSRNPIGFRGYIVDRKDSNLEWEVLYMVQKKMENRHSTRRLLEL